MEVRKVEKWKSRFRAVLFTVGVLMTVAVPLPLAIWGPQGNFVVICFISGALAVLYSRIDALEEFSLGPLKAKLRAALSEAAATVAQVRNLASELSGVALTTVIATEFMGGMEPAEKFNLHNKIIRCLTDLGASDEQVRSARDNWIKGVSVMYYRLIRRTVEGRVEFTRINSAITAQESTASNQILAESNVDSWVVAKPATIRSIVRANGIDKPELDAWIDDYEAFLNTGEIPRFEHFLKNQRQRAG